MNRDLLIKLVSINHKRTACTTCYYYYDKIDLFLICVLDARYWKWTVGKLQLYRTKLRRKYSTTVWLTRPWPKVYSNCVYTYGIPERVKLLSLKHFSDIGGSV